MRHAAAVHDAMADLVARFPNVPKAMDTFVAVASQRGRAHLDGPRPWLSTKAAPWTDRAWRTNLAWERRNRKRWTVERRRSQVADNFHHEYAHVLSTPAVMADWRKVYNARGPAWFLDHVSHYAASPGKPQEALAEAFALCTRRRYRRGSLPADIEDFVFKRLLKEP
jgi:hypothetical protein